MTRIPIGICVSSVQSEFEQERRALSDYVDDDVRARRFFDVFLFEAAPSVDRRPGQLYLDEVANERGAAVRRNGQGADGDCFYRRNDTESAT